MIDFEQIIRTYTDTYARARARRDPRADAYGRRLTYWIRTAECNGHFTDTGNAFQMGRHVSQSNILQVA